MKTLETHLPGLFLFELDRHFDERGFFSKLTIAIDIRPSA